MGEYLIPTKIVGVTFNNKDKKNRQDIIKEIKPEDKLFIKEDYNNPYDSNAHLVKHGDDELGYLSGALSEDLVNKKSEGETIVGIDEFKITGGENNCNYGVNIMIRMNKP